MKIIKIKVFLLVVSIFAIINLTFADEVITKNGNTTVITLQDDNKKGNLGTGLFGSNPEPLIATYEYNAGAEQRDTYNWSASNGNSSEYNVSYNGSLLIKDENQYLVNLSTTSNSIRMTQDDEYYYFDVNIKYKNEELIYNPGVIVRTNNSSITEYQKINNGQLYLASEPINSLSYEYKSNSYIYINDYWTRTDGYKVYSPNATSVQQSLYFKMNNKEGKQIMTMSVPSSSITNSYSGTFTQNNSEVNTFNSAYSTYSSLVLPFEKYFGKSWSRLANSNRSPLFMPTTFYNGENRNIDNFYFYYPSVITNVTATLYKPTVYDSYSASITYNQYADIIIGTAKYLFTNGQPNYTMPQRLDYEPIIQNNITKENVNYWNNTFNSKIKIKKEDINKYRYLNMYCNNAIDIEGSITSGVIETDTGSSGAVSKYRYSSTPDTIKSLSVHSNEAIDLIPYINCEHNWLKKRIDDHNTHELYCTKCKWAHREPHNFIYEYDGFTNNLCECGQNNRVNYHFHLNSDNLGALNSVLNTNSDYVKYNDLTKIGYTLNYFKKYEKQFTNMTNPTFGISSTSIINRFVENVATMSELTGNFSTTYEAVYKPIKYNIHFDLSVNNKGLSLSITAINDMHDLEYGRSYDIPAINFNGYAFEGWTTTSGGSIANYEAGKRFKNLTTTDGATIILYPVFDEANYKFIFYKENNLNLEILSEMPTLKCYMNTNYTLPNNIELTGYIFKGWSTTYKGTTIDFQPNQPLYNYTNECRIYKLYPVYEPIKYKFVFSSTNNLGVYMDDTIPEENYKYGEEKEISEHIHLTGYGFKGWVYDIASYSNISISPKQKIKNFTTENNKEYILYPVYEVLKFNVIYQTPISSFASNNSNIITKNYLYFDNFIIEKPKNVVNYEAVGKSDSITKTIPFMHYKDLLGNIYNNADDIKQYFNNIGLSNLNLYLYAVFGAETVYDSRWGQTSDSSSSSSERIDTIHTYDDNKKEITPVINEVNQDIENNDTKINVKKNIFNTIKKAVIKKDLVDLLNEIFNDWNDKNNHSTLKQMSSKNKTKKDIVDLLNEIFDDFNTNNGLNYDLVTGFTNTLEVADTSPATSSYIKEVNNNKINKYLTKVFKNNKDLKKVNNFLNDLNNRNYEKIYQDLIEGKYEEMIDNFINDYEGIFNDIKVELNKVKYKDFSQNLTDKLKDNKYNELKKEINTILIKYNNETEEIENLIKRLNFKTLIINLNKGKYKIIVNEIRKEIMKSKYDNIRKDFINEFAEGEYTEIVYDFIYYFLDLIYNYKVDVINETKVIETTKKIIIEETTNKDIVEKTANKDIKINIIPILGFTFMLIMILIIAYIIINRKRE